MSITKRNDAKNQIIDILNEQGYPSYSKLVSLFDIYLTDNPDVIGYMIPGKAKIVLNAGLNIDQVSTIVRHEILHEYLVHGPRGEAFEKLHSELLSDPQLSNIAADYEISNKGYTDADKMIARAIRLGDKTLVGLVTEDDHPDWLNLSFEEMYEKLLQEKEKNEENVQKELEKSESISKKDIEDLQDDIDKQQHSASTSSGSEEYSDKLDKMSDKLDDIKDKVKEADKSENEPFDSAEEQEKNKELAERVKKIKDAFEDAKKKQEIESENVGAKRKEKQTKEIRNIERINKSGISKFKLSLNKFISNQVEEEEEETYARENPAYADEGEFILPGKLVRENKHIPIINVYWDVSGSFQDPAKTQAARNAIATLNTYVRAGDIEIHSYYFADEVSDNINSAGGGTNAHPVVEHIKQTKPDNVIIITDADTSGQHLPSVTVPGAVWMLFYGGRSNALMDSVRGKRENKYFDIEY